MCKLRKKVLASISILIFCMISVIIVKAENVVNLNDYEKYFSFNNTIDDALAVNMGMLDTVEKTFTFTTGKNESALVINENESNPDNVGLDTGIVVEPEDSFTISFWVKAYNAPFAAPVVWIGTADQSEEDWIGFWSGLDNENAWHKSAGLGSNDAADARVGIISSLSDTAEFGYDYVTFSVDSVTHKGTLYYNGIEVGRTEEELPLLKTDSHVYIGANAWDEPAHMDIDDFVFYRRALNSEEISALYERNGRPDSTDMLEQEQTREPITLQVSTDPYKGVEFVTTQKYVIDKTATIKFVLAIVALVGLVAVSSIVIYNKKKPQKKYRKRRRK